MKMHKSVCKLMSQVRSHGLKNTLTFTENRGLALIQSLIQVYEYIDQPIKGPFNNIQTLVNPIMKLNAS